MPNNQQYERVLPLLGTETFQRLSQVRIIIFGIGGVGSWCAESLIRSGIQNLTLVDFDVVSPSNINRQAPASFLTLGQAKVTVMRERLLTLSSNAKIKAINQELTPDNITNFQLNTYDFIIDAIDSVPSKTALLLAASKSNATVFSSMGAAGKTDISQIQVSEFWKVFGCPLAAALRQRMKKAQTFPNKKILCVFSPEHAPVLTPANDGPTTQTKGSLMHITASFGLRITQLILQSI